MIAPIRVKGKWRRTNVIDTRQLDYDTHNVLVGRVGLDGESYTVPCSRSLQSFLRNVSSRAPGVRLAADSVGPLSFWEKH